MNTVETKIQEYLVSHGIYPYSILFIKGAGVLKISFYLPTDIPEFLEAIEYSKLCDNSGFQEYQDNTILIFGTLLSKILRDVGYTENN